MQIVRTKLSRFILLVVGGHGFVFVGVFGYIGYRENLVEARRAMGIVGLIAGVSLGGYILASALQNRRGILIGEPAAVVLRRRGFSVRGRTIERLTNGLGDLRIEVAPIFPANVDSGVQEHPSSAETMVRIRVIGRDGEISFDIDSAWICDDIQQRFDTWQRSISSAPHSG